MSSTKYLDDFHILRDDFVAFQRERTNDRTAFALAETWLALVKEQAEAKSDITTASQTAKPILERSGSMEVLENTDNVSTTDEASEFVAAAVTQSLRPRKGHKKSRQGCFNCKRR